MSDKADLELLLDAVSDHLDIASQSGCSVNEIIDCVEQAVAFFLLDKMSVEDALEVVRTSAARMMLRIPALAGDPNAKH
ncbi:hypothetical protein [Mesorhizobium sp. M7A.F.Ca.MR.362.00.0.0]|uniref:hypothetical protein n=1 Tax=Mesorhizobium sp. M7A.F.Ca.MR.362.00.0.0 TaxID=2496779 RepID=UPI000FD5E07E|nr:hypothetical protein [Mesorhizobium sp. M7A.F.Ca.MR.362.00.0.0]RUU78239.1 hypothetical protein EOC06_20705 [Mesorhizobium sp. M7A.F.Ca.MR.362.00.0.0]RWN95429.1 MAG: hypothetical protein EOS05_11590 [Mesorhizobium sp.]